MNHPTAALWIGTYPTAGDRPGAGEGIWRVGVDGDGMLAAGEQVAQVPAPSFLAADPSGRGLLAVSETEPGGLTRLQVLDDGTLAATGTAATGGTNPCHLVATESAVWVANYGDGTAAVVPLADGALGSARPHAHSGSGAVADRQEGPHAHFVHLWGDRVLVSDLGTDELRTYPLNGVGQAGGPAGGATDAPGNDAAGTPPGNDAAGTEPADVAAVLPPGTGPRHLAELSDGTILLVGELDCRLHVLVPAGPGRLEHVGSMPITGRTQPDGTAGYPSHITVAGDLVHVGVRGPDVLSVLRVRPAGAASSGRAPADDGAASPGTVGHLRIEQVADVDLGAGAWPRHHAVVAGGDVVVVAAQNTDELVAVRLDPSGTGHVTDRLALPVPACVLEA